MSKEIQAYVAQHEQDFFEGLCDLLRRPTVSTDPQYRGELESCAAYLAEFGREKLGFTTRVVPTAGHPCVIMHSEDVPGAARVLLYGHYDVQPAEDVELWRRPPFEPYLESCDGKEHPEKVSAGGQGLVIRGRGTCDDKGQFWAWLCALRTLRETRGQMPVNITVLLEGEEEIGSLNLPRVLEEHREELGVDVAIVSDTGTAVKYIPTMHYALRGLISFEIALRTAAQDLHSGVHGGVSPNAAVELANIIAKLHDSAGRVVIPGFYDGVRAIEPWEKEALAAVPFDEEEYARGFATTLRGEAGFSTNERRWFRPTLECNGMSGGYTGPGAKTIVPAAASAKFSARLVADQDPAHIMECVQRWFSANCPEWVQLDFVAGELCRPYLLEKSGVGAQLFAVAEAALREGFQREPLLCRNGGAIGIVAEFSRVLGVPTLLLGLGSPDDAIHGPNEKLELANFYSGIRMGADLLERLAQQNK